MRTDVSRWGNSLAIRIPRAVAEQARLSEGDTVTLEAGPDGTVVIRPGRPLYTLRELVDAITRSNRHSETDWGGPIGHETW